MSFHERISVDDSLNIHPDARLTSFDRRNEQPGGYRTHLPNSRQSAGSNNPLGPTQEAEADSRERSELVDLFQADAPQPSTNETLATDSLPTIRHVDEGGRILKISSLNQPSGLVSSDWQLRFEFCSHLPSIV